MPQRAPGVLDIAKRGEVRLIGLDWKDEDPTATDWIKQLGNPFDVIPTGPRRTDRDRLGCVWCAGVVSGEPGGHRRLQVRWRLHHEAWQSEFLPRINTKS